MFLQNIAVVAAKAWKLTKRQTEVFGYVMQGLSNKEIANILDCAERTVELHMSAILSKAGCDRRGALMAKAITDFGKR